MDQMKQYSCGITSYSDTSHCESTSMATRRPRALNLAKPFL